MTARHCGSPPSELEMQVLHLGASLRCLEQHIREERSIAKARCISGERRMEANLIECEKRFQANMEESQSSAEKLRHTLDGAVEAQVQVLRKSLVDMCEQRLQEGEDQLQLAGDSLKTAADAAARDLGRHMDAKLSDLGQHIEAWLEDLSHDTNAWLKAQFADLSRHNDAQLEQIRSAEDEWGGVILQEVRQGLQGLLAKTCNFEGRLEQYAFGEDLDKRLQLLVALLRDLEAKVYRVEAHVMKFDEKLTETAHCLKELAQRMPMNLPDRAAVEQMMAKQAEEQTQTTRWLRELLQSLPERLTDVEQLCERTERRAATLEDRCERMDEDVCRATQELDAFRQSLLQRMSEAERCLQSIAERLEREGMVQYEALMHKASQGETRQRDLEMQWANLLQGSGRQLEENVGPQATVAVGSKTSPASAQCQRSEQQSRQLLQLHLPQVQQIQSLRQEQHLEQPRQQQQQQQQLQQRQQQQQQQSFEDAATSPALTQEYMRPNPFRDPNCQANTPTTPQQYRELSTLYQPAGLFVVPSRASPGLSPAAADTPECCGLF